jgi:AbiV family abortive infection protein
MAGSVSPSVLLCGSLFALEQCGRLLEDASILFEQSRHSTAAGLALLAREELGRHKILLDLRRKAAAGEAVTIADVTRACIHHETKQRRAQLSLRFRAHAQSRIGQLIDAQIQNPSGSAEYAEAEAELGEARKQKWKRQPGDRHRVRQSAFYVDPLSSGSGWSRPSELPTILCAETLSDAINDYMLAWDRVEHAEPVYDRELGAAIGLLSLRVALPTVRHPPSLSAALSALPEPE